MYGTFSYSTGQYAGEADGILGLTCIDHAHLTPSLTKTGAQIFLEHLHVTQFFNEVKLKVKTLLESADMDDAAVGMVVLLIKLFIEHAHLLDGISRKISKTLLEVVDVDDDERETDMIYFIRTHLNVLHPRGAERRRQVIPIHFKILYVWHTFLWGR